MLVILSGLLKTVTFRNPENGYCVLRLTCEDPLGVQTVVGCMPQLEPGESLEFEGEWKEHAKFGRQFLATSVQPRLPTQGADLIRYLSSGLFPGVGPKIAQRIVDRFAERTLEVLDQSPALLAEVQGLRGKRLQAFQDAWREMRGSRETMLFLYAHQIAGSIALRLWRQYKSQTIAVIRENPYVLAEEVWGIGFTKADEIALKLGIPRDSYQRLQSGLKFTLVRAATQGHTYLPRNLLLEQVAEVLRLGGDEEALHRLLYSLDGLISDGDLELQGDAVFLPALRRAEESFSRWVRAALEKGELGDSASALEEELRSFEHEQGIRYAPAQFQGICAAVRSPFYILTGGPGTGKTTTLRGILHLLDQRNARVLLCAPTGRAARRMGELTGRDAFTLHRLLEIDPKTRRFTRNAERPLEASWVVVDEFSMVDTWLAAALVQALGPTTHLLLVGDQDQLPSIGPGSLLRDLLSCERVPAMRLTQVFRQQGGSDIAENAHRINQGFKPNLVDGTHFHYLQEGNVEQALKRVVALVSQHIPAQLACRPRYDIQVLTPMHKGPLGTHVLNPSIQAALNPGQREFLLAGTRWRLGDRVMQLRNDYERGIFNGDIGFVVALDPEEQEMEVDFEGRSVTLPVECLSDLSLAYACTVHKSQGSEYRAVVIVLDVGHYSMLQRNLVYTAVTRAKGGVWIVATPTALDQAIRNNRLNHRFTRLAQSIRAGEGFREWLELS